jgi:hypothetical protein
LRPSARSRATVVLTVRADFYNPLARCGRNQKFNEFVDIACMLPKAFLVLGGGRHRIELLPLIDVDQQPIRLFRRDVEAAINDARECVCIATPVEFGFPFEVGVDLGWPGILWSGSERGRKGPERRLAGSERDDIPHRSSAFFA